MDHLEYKTVTGALRDIGERFLDAQANSLARWERHKGRLIEQGVYVTFDELKVGDVVDVVAGHRLYTVYKIANGRVYFSGPDGAFNDATGFARIIERTGAYDESQEFNKK